MPGVKKKPNNNKTNSTTKENPTKKEIILRIKVRKRIFKINGSDFFREKDEKNVSL